MEHLGVQASLDIHAIPTLARSFHCEKVNAIRHGFKSHAANGLIDSAIPYATTWPLRQAKSCSRYLTNGYQRLLRLK